MMTNNTITTCNLCGQSFQLGDKLLSVRKKRHEEHHKIPGVSKNIIRGKVEWV